MRKGSSNVLVVAVTIFAAVSIALGQEPPREINGGILNGKATQLPKPAYPHDLRTAGIQGTVQVAVTIDEEGNVIAAEPLIGAERTHVVKADRDVESPVETLAEPPHPLLQEAAREAAMKARFSPTMLSGVPVKVKGIITYNFVVGEPDEPDISKSISGGILNGKAIELPAPEYPPAAKAVRASGTVTIQILINENGDIESAKAVSGHPLLRAAATEAALKARFSPTVLEGVPVRVTGILTYNFVLPEVVDQ